MKDILGREVKVGDEVVVLIKVYGYRKLSDAKLAKKTYTGKSQYGETFNERIHIRNPQCVKV